MLGWVQPGITPLEQVGKGIAVCPVYRCGSFWSTLHVTLCGDGAWRHRSQSLVPCVQSIPVVFCRGERAVKPLMRGQDRGLGLQHFPLQTSEPVAPCGSGMPSSQRWHPWSLTEVSFLS